MILRFSIGPPTKLNGHYSGSMIVPESAIGLKLVTECARSKKPGSGYPGDKMLRDLHEEEGN